MYFATTPKEDNENDPTPDRRNAFRCEVIISKNDIGYLCLPSGLCGSIGRFCGMVEKGVIVFWGRPTSALGVADVGLLIKKIAIIGGVRHADGITDVFPQNEEETRLLF